MPIFVVLCLFVFPLLLKNRRGVERVIGGMGLGEGYTSYRLDQVKLFYITQVIIILPNSTADFL